MPLKQYYYNFIHWIANGHNKGVTVCVRGIYRKLSLAYSFVISNDL